MSSPARPLTLVSVVGPGRSGTTLLGALLAELDDVGTTGELRWLWERGVLRQRPCACGKPPTECAVWSRVLVQSQRRPVQTVDQTADQTAEQAAEQTVDQARGPATGMAGRSDDESSAHANLMRLIAAQHEISRTRRRLRLVRRRQRGSAGPGDEVDQLVRDASWRAIRAFATVAGTPIVVDTSKRPVDGAVWADIAAEHGLEHFVVHIVRDPRGVVNSWGRPKVFSVDEVTHRMAARGLVASVIRWVSNCLEAELLRRRVPDDHWCELRYEDFADDPRAAVTAIAALIRAGPPAFFCEDSDDSVLLGPNHMVAGNPSRFRTGMVRIRTDDAWRTTLSRRDQRLVEVLTAPLMLRYGYFRRSAPVPPVQVPV